MNYAGRGTADDSNGLNYDTETARAYPGRKVDYGNIPGVGNLYDILTSVQPGGPANLLAGVHNDFAPDGPNGTAAEAGFPWNSVLRAGLSVCNYGMFVNLGSYIIPQSLGGASLARTPSATGSVVAYPANPALIPVTDPYFRGFDNVYPDVGRLEEWKREFDQYAANGNLPSLSLVRLMHDHQGNYDTAVGGFNTPEAQVGDNDLAVGRLVDYVAHSRFAGSTLIFVLEDDAQAGSDHMDVHRSTAYVVGPYVKHNAVVHTRYSTVNMLRTIEDVLGVDHLNLNDAYQGPMTDVFDLNQKTRSFNAVALSVLRNAQVWLPDESVKFASGPQVTPTHDSGYWAAATRGFDFSGEDRVPADLFNRVQWEGLKGTPYPQVRSGVFMGLRDQAPDAMDETSED